MKHYPMYYCWPMPIMQYKKLIENVYDRAGIISLCKWKLKDNHTYSLPDSSE